MNAQVQVKPRTRAGSWAQFERRYGPIDGPDGTPMRGHGEIGDAPERCVWTVVDCDGVLYVLPGFHTVNYMGRIVTEREWSDAEFDNPGYRY